MPSVYAYRLNPSHENQTKNLLDDGQIAIGWSKARVVEPSLTKEDVQQEIDRCYPHLKGEGKLTKDVNQVWRFLRELEIGDIVLVPDGNDVHFLRVVGGPVFLDGRTDDTAIRRDVAKILAAPVKRTDLPAAIKDKLTFRGPSLKLDIVKDNVLDFLSLDAEVEEAEKLAAKHAHLLLEAMGSYHVPAQDEKLVARKHAEVLNAFAAHLRSQGFKVANERKSGLGPDLFTVEESFPSLFEVKIGAGAGDYLKAVGQLLVYEQLLGRPHRKFLIAPVGMKPFATDILGRLGVGIIEYTETTEGFEFDSSQDGHLLYIAS